MRRALDLLYDGAGLVAGLFMFATLAFVVIGIAGRLLHFHLPGTDAYAGYMMAACAFLALAHTLRRGEHIRVTLLLQQLPDKAGRSLQVLSHVIGAAFAAFLAWYSARLVWQSRMFNDISTSNDATPLWIPQLAMAVGSAILLVAVLDETIALVRRRGAPTRPPAEQSRVE
jgi:TRAP-type C4-dicarboxylate transport system permease small subunit